MVTRTIGSRYAGLTAPAAVDPGATFTAKATFVNHGNLPITNGTVRLQRPRPDGSWFALGERASLSLRPGQSATRNFRVTAPEQAEGEVKSLTAELLRQGIVRRG